ncbi:Inner membrane ABC transporter permease protein YdcV [subsurface metagenome]
MKPSHSSPRLLTALSVFVYIFMWAPAIVLIVFSFSSNKFGVKWEHFTLKWYYGIINNVGVRNALLKSVFIALVTVVIATIGGTVTAYGLYKFKFRLKGTLRTAILLPILIPYIVTAGSLLVYYTRVIHIPLGYITVIIAHVTFSLPLSVFVVLGRMQRINWTLEEASMDLGANKITTWKRITIPLLMPAIIASAALIFPWSFNDFTVTYFTSGVGLTTLPVYVFSQIRYGRTPVINTIGTVFLMLPIIIILVMSILRKKEMF